MFDKKAKEHVRTIGKYIESLGGKLYDKAASGSIYYDLSPIKKIRIADHLSNKNRAEYLQIIVLKEDNYCKYLCIYSRNILLLKNVAQVKQWLQDVYFVFHVNELNGHTFVAVNDDKYTEIKKDVAAKDVKLMANKKEIEKLNRILQEKENAYNKINERYHEAVKYHNMWQEAESKANKLHKKLEKLLHKIHENDQTNSEQIVYELLPK